MLFRHWVLLFYECIIAALFVYLTFDDPYDIWLTNVNPFAAENLAVFSY